MLDIVSSFMRKKKVFTKFNDIFVIITVGTSYLWSTVEVVWNEPMAQ